MKICIIGRGFVGEATALTLKYEPIWHDPPKGFVADYKSADVIFICCFDDMLDFYLKELKNHPCVIIRSTLIPGKVQGTDFAVYPEFLVERTWQKDAVDPIQIVFGGTKDQFEKLKGISILDFSKAVITSNSTAALMKVTTNVFLAIKVLFMNHLYQVCQQSGIDYEEFKQALKVDKRLGHSHFDVPGPDGKLGFGGKCFPKDVELMAEFMKSNDLDHGFFRTVLDLNRDFRNDQP